MLDSAVRKELCSRIAAFVYEITLLGSDIISFRNRCHLNANMSKLFLMILHALLSL